MKLKKKKKMFTDALWSTMLSIILLLSLTIFFKMLFFRHIYEAGELTSIQIVVDWRLWILDIWFWSILASLFLISIILNCSFLDIEKRCKKKNRRNREERESSIERIKHNENP